MTEIAPCAGKWELFDSVLPKDHEDAADICRTCPMVEWCRAQRDKPGQFAPALLHHGTWAGELWIKGERVDLDARPPKGRPRKVRSCESCGTEVEKGRRYCLPCREASRRETQRAYDAERNHRRRNRRRDRTEGRENHCLRCGAQPGRDCTTPSGLRATDTHAIRRGKKCIGCSVAIDGRPDYCDPCRVVARRQQKRESLARIAEKREAAA